MACVPGGKVVTVGMGMDNLRLPVSTITVKEIELLGSFRFANTVRTLTHAQPAQAIT